MKAPLLCTKIRTGGGKQRKMDATETDDVEREGGINRGRRHSQKTLYMTLN